MLWSELQRELPYDNSEMVRQDISVEVLTGEEQQEQTTTDSEGEEDELMDIAWDEDIMKDIGLE